MGYPRSIVLFVWLAKCTTYVECYLGKCRVGTQHLAPLARPLNAAAHAAFARLSKFVGDGARGQRRGERGAGAIFVWRPRLEKGPVTSRSSTAMMPSSARDTHQLPLLPKYHCTLPAINFILVIVKWQTYDATCVRNIWLALPSFIKSVDTNSVLN